MINLLSATPGSGKSLLATEILLNLSRDNVANLKFNYYFAKSFFERLEQKKLTHYLDQVLVTKGQGLERTTELVFFEDGFFDFLKDEYFINVISNPQTDDIVTNFPEFYFERIMYLNLIVDNLNEEHNLKFQHFKPVRTIYTNIADLKLVQCRSLPADCDWRNTPQGSYFAIDEAQLINIFSDEARGIDPIVKDLTIHRHKGYDFLFITQEPSFVHKYIRKLASLHIHLVNIFGWEQSMRIEWSTVQDAPNSVKSIARCENMFRWRFPQHVYNLYKSTTINTRKKRIPKKIVICLVFGILLFVIAFFLMFATDNSNPLFNILMGKPVLSEQQLQTNSASAQNNKVDKNSSDQTEASASSAHTTETSASSASSAETVQKEYDITDPFAFEPATAPAVVNHRVFSGCFCTQNTCKAYDNQGTLIQNINPKLCTDLIKDSAQRPFDYFNARSEQMRAGGGTFDQSAQARNEQSAGVIHE